MNWQIVFPHTTPKPDVVIVYKPAPVRRVSPEEASADAEFLKAVHDIVTNNNAQRKGESNRDQTV